MNKFELLFTRKKMPLIMSLPANKPEWCEAAFEAGADAVKVHINLHHIAGGEDLGGYEENREAFVQMLKSAKGPMGIVPGEDSTAILKEIETVKASGFEFISFYSKFMPISALPIKQTLMPAIDSEFTYEELDSYQKLGAGVIEASVIPSNEYGTPLSFKDLALYSSIKKHTNLPVVVPTQRFIQPEDVKYLYRAGVRGIMIGAIVTGKTEQGITDAIKRYRMETDKL